MEKTKKLSGKKLVAICLIVILAIGLVLTTVFVSLYFCHEPVESYRVITYMEYIQVPQIAQRHYENYTHIIYGYIDLKKDEGPTVNQNFRDGLAATQKYMAENCPDTKIMLCMGGMGFCKYTRTAEKRKEVVDFIENLVNECRENGRVDGLDMDWEYPCRNAGDDPDYCIHDANDWLALLQDLRERMGDDFLLSIAMSGSITFQNDLPMRKMAKVLDFVNIMTYDLAVPKHCSYIDTKASVFNAYLGGFKREQINMGLPLYARSKGPRYNEETDEGSGEYMSYDDIMEKAANGEIEIKSNYDYSYADYRGYRMCFDNLYQTLRKVNHVKQRGYGGVFSWYSEYNLDGYVMSVANEMLNG